MIKFYGKAKNLDGVAVSGASATIVDSLTLSNADLFCDDTGTPLANPVTADTNGVFWFYVEPGDFNIIVEFDVYAVNVDNVSIEAEEFVSYLVNNEGTTITEGTVVYSSGDGLVKKSHNNDTFAKASAEMICLQDVINGDTGKFMRLGLVSLSGPAGFPGYLDTNGAITSIIPLAYDGAKYLTILGYWIKSGIFLFSTRQPLYIEYDNPIPIDSMEMDFSNRDNSSMTSVIGKG